jgi:hypothetical protein
MAGETSETVWALVDGSSTAVVPYCLFTMYYRQPPKPALSSIIFNLARARNDNNNTSMTNGFPRPFLASAKTEREYAIQPYARSGSSCAWFVTNLDHYSCRRRRDWG